METSDDDEGNNYLNKNELISKGYIFRGSNTRLTYNKREGER